MEAEDSATLLNPEDDLAKVLMQSGAVLGHPLLCSICTIGPVTFFFANIPSLRGVHVFVMVPHFLCAHFLICSAFPFDACFILQHGLEADCPFVSSPAAGASEAKRAVGLDPAKDDTYRNQTLAESSDSEVLARFSQTPSPPPLVPCNYPPVWSGRGLYLERHLVAPSKNGLSACC